MFNLIYIDSNYLLKKLNQQRKMATVKIDAAKCKGCGSCIDACPEGMFELKENKAIIAKDISECLACHACESACPEGAITVED